MTEGQPNGARVVAFRSPHFAMPWDDVAMEKPWGEDCARYFAEGLAEAGLKTHPPIEGSDGWVVDCDVDGKSFSLFIHWAPLGPSAEDSWVCQMAQRRGLLRSVFTRGTEPIPRRLCDEMDRLVRAVPSVSSVQWLSESRFRDLY